VALSLADPEDDRERVARRQRNRQSHFDKLSRAMRSIASSRCLENPTLQADRAKSKLLRRIESHKAVLLRDLRYDMRLEPWRRKVELPDEQWARYLVRLHTKQKELRRWISRFQESQPLKRKRAIAKRRREAIMDAISATLNADQLRPVERRAVELLRGQPPKPKKNRTEERAIHLAGLIKQDWGLSKKRKPHVSLERDKLLQILQTAENDPDKHVTELLQAIHLTITDVVSIAAPIIEEFAQEPIAFRKRVSDSHPPSFEALYSIVCACVEDGATCKKSTVNRTLKQVRKRSYAQST
jgi:hypothetical protein